MSEEIRILFVEDMPADVAMVNHELRRAGLLFRSKRVESKQAFLRELEHQMPDVILSDHGLPTFDGFTALAVARNRCPEIPFIFVTGAHGEKMAIQSFESGATDYVLKSDLTRLAPAVRRAVGEARERARLKRQEQALRESEERFRMLVESVKDYAIFMLDPEGHVVSWNSGAHWMHGYGGEEILGRNFSQFYTAGDLARHRPEVALRTAAGEGRFEEEGLRLGKSGKEFWASVVITPLRDDRGNLRGFSQVTRDITERKTSEATLQKSEERYRLLVERCPATIFVVQSDDRIAFANRAAVKLVGAPGMDQLDGQPARELFRPDPWVAVLRRLRRLPRNEPPTVFTEEQLVRLDGTTIVVEISAAPIGFLDKPAVQVIAHDITQRHRAEEALRKSEALKSTILETALDAILSVDHKGLIQEWNSAARRIFGYRRDQAVGRPMDELIIPASLREVYRDGLTNYLMTGVGSLLNRPIEMTLQRDDGSEFRAEMAITRIPTDEPVRCTALVRDITERKQAEAALREAEQRFRRMIEDVQDYAIYMLDPDGRVTTWNAGAERISGHIAEEIVGRPFATFFTPEDIERGVPAATIEKAATEGRALHEGWRLRKEGSRFRVQGILTALRDESGALYGFSEVARDVTKQKEAEEEIQRLNEQLEQRVRERTAQLEAANQELEAFSYSVSHDLRAPLCHIAGYVEILQTEAAAKLDDRGRNYLQTVADSARKLGELIDALLALSRMGRAEMREDAVDLGTLFEEAQRELRQEMQGRNLDWQIGSLPTVRGDPLMLRQVLVNLLSNALKYTRTRRQGRIAISARETEAEYILGIRDNGVGFDMKHAGKLFGVFQRLHRPSEFEGTGIGLANVRHIIHRHGGRTWAEGEVGRGATFYFSIPKTVKDTR